MNAVTCELCGSNDLIKAEGVFVCQHCGTKYSLEEARKLMVEATVKIDGPVRVDGIATADSLLMRAKDFELDGDFDSAESYYNRVLDIDARNVEAKTGLERIRYHVSGPNLTFDFTEGNGGQCVGLFVDGAKRENLWGGQKKTFELSGGTHTVGAAGGVMRCKNPATIEIDRKSKYLVRIRFKGLGVQFDVTRC